MRAILKYPGSKWSTADWIISNFPKHHTYIEPYFGSGAVLFNKKISAIETVNDLDDEVVNLFNCIKKDSDRLARLISLTPYSRKEYDNSFIAQENDEFEKALRFLVRCWQGHGFRTNGYKVGWKNDVQGRENMYAAYNWYRLPEWIAGIVDRLKQVQIDCQPAIKFIKRHKYQNVLIYADPPYLLSTRSGKQYKHEMNEQDHIELLELLIEHPGPVIISGYQSEIYDEMLTGWNKKTTKGMAEYFGEDRNEVIWMNYEPPNEQISFDTAI
ncbi:Phage modification methylase [Acetoanaerobium sticklandii]|uniref:Phage modification methylase n=1 Tax=Acetoanaerobium sticklandii (strain ATCC 12662 / DSM 519 / JCM 1433 / CCUG 9281 / NCIMB 10654 / HF) TaxID=499177 RepID=E3PS13_ACESD|nr:DNA adenine methylase [Acetoanaerobium sticklandii]CBH21667.1 Phage modification methylase [Acetoanaerobium sticklandii]